MFKLLAPLILFLTNLPIAQLGMAFRAECDMPCCKQVVQEAKPIELATPEKPAESCCSSKFSSPQPELKPFASKVSIQSKASGDSCHCFIAADPPSDTKDKGTVTLPHWGKSLITLAQAPTWQPTQDLTSTPLKIWFPESNPPPNPYLNISEGRAPPISL